MDTEQGLTLLHRPVCDLLGWTYPIVLAGMRGVARSELVAAESPQEWLHDRSRLAEGPSLTGDVRPGRN
jgi:NAD(P)H-dependent flavin oxidoreductase YrpB (nitropropane dioxygenase family)